MRMGWPIEAWTHWSPLFITCKWSISMLEVGCVVASQRFGDLRIAGPTMRRRQVHRGGSLRIAAEVHLDFPGVDDVERFGVEQVGQAERVAELGMLVVARRLVGGDQPAAVAHETPHRVHLGVRHRRAIGEEEDFVLFQRAAFQFAVVYQRHGQVALEHGLKITEDQAQGCE